MSAPMAQSPGGPVITPKEERYLLEKERVLGPLLLLPAVIYIFALVGFPLVLAILYAFSNVNVGDPRIDGTGDFVGFDNFRAVMNDGVFWKALRNTIVFTVVTQIVVIVLANILALVLSNDFRGKRLVRFLVLLPWTTPIGLGVLGWFWLLDSVYSPIDYLLREVGLLGPQTPLGPARNLYYLAETELAQASVLTVQVWRILPLATVILLAGLSSIPQDIKDAANVDGAGFWRQVFYVRLPLLLPIMAVASLFSMVFVFTDLIVPLVLTRGGPVNDTQMLASWAYFKGIQGGNLAQGAAIALFLLPVMIAVAIGCVRMSATSTTPMPIDEPGERAAKRTRVAGRTILYITATVFALFAALPFAWMILTVFKQNTDLYNRNANPFLYNQPPTLSNIDLLFNDTNYVTFLVNTLIVALCTTVITVIAVVPAAYSLTRLAGRWGESLGILIFLVYLVPPTLLFIPLTGVVADLGLQNSKWSLVLVYPTFTIPFCTWLLMGFFRSVPWDIEEQAMIDGYSRLGAIWRTVIPVSVPGILTVVIFSFTLALHEFVYSLAFVQSSAEKTVSVGVFTELIRGDVYFWQALMAAAAIVAFPVALLYNYFLDRFISGFTLGAVKG